MSNRRDFVKTVVAGGAAALLMRQLASGHPVDRAFPTTLFPDYAAADPWAQLPSILERIKPPVFSRRDFSITHFGAVGNGKTDCTDAFRKAIAACNQAGGGRVVVPAGEFLTGAIQLKSNVNLHIAKGGTIKFSRDPRMYLPVVFTRWEGMELMNYSPFIYAFEQTNLAITGEGVIDGNADCEHWWPWKGRPQCGWKKGDPDQNKARALLYDYVANATPVSRRVFGDGSYLRPNFIQPYRCKNVLIEGVTLRNSPMWQLHPVLCTNVTIRDVRIEREEGAGSQTGPNCDGCDPESCTDVLIDDCYFATGDDCIAIKSGRNDDGRRIAAPSQNIIIRGCQMEDGHGGITVGSEISGGVRNVFGMNCKLNSPRLDHALRFKNNAMRGGLLENMFFRDITVGEVTHAAITVDFNYEEGANGKYTPVLRNLQVENLKSGKSKYAMDLQGFPSAPIINVRLEDCTFDNTAEPSILKNVQGLEFRNVRVNGKVL